MPTSNDAFEDGFAPLYDLLNDADARFHGQTMVDDLLALAPMAGENTAEAARLYLELAILQTKRYDETSLDYAKIALDSHEASGGLSELQLYWLYFSCGDYAMNEGKSVARDYLEQAMTRFELFDRPPLEAVSLKQKMVVALKTEKRHQEALALAMEALSEGEAILGKDHEDLQVVTNYIVDSHRQLGDFPKAIEWQKRRLDLLEKNGDVSRMLDSYGSLADLEFSAGAYDAAKEWHKKRIAHAYTHNKKVWIDISNEDYAERFDPQGNPKT